MREDRSCDAAVMQFASKAKKAVSFGWPLSFCGDSIPKDPFLPADFSPRSSHWAEDEADVGDTVITSSLRNEKHPLHEVFL